PRSLDVHTACGGQGAHRPGETPLVSQGKKFPYWRIKEDANRLAHHLIRKGVGPGNLVGVSVERSPELTVALLGVLKTGAAYVPLDPSYPLERLALTLEDTRAECVLSNNGNSKRQPDTIHNRVVLDSEAEAIRDESPHNPSVELSGVQRAYVLYTSGSSGKPKGVEGTHRGAMNRMRWMWERYPFEAGEVCCQKTNVGFVDSVWEIFGPLLAGVPSVILPQEAVLDPEKLLQILAEERVTRIVLVPSLLRALLEHAPNLEERVPELKLWSCSGEVLTWELTQRFRKGYPEAKLLNIYGSSEVAADVTWHEVGEKEELGEKEEEAPGTVSVPIGRPISNTQVYVLDRNRNAVPVGVRGEIYVGGDGLALGYWRQPEMTAERFVGNPMVPEESARLYRTGDLGRWRRDGEIEYLGRMDGEVKVRGMRIELGEIETVLASHRWVEEAVVELSGEGADQRLVAYVVAGEEGTPSARELRRHVRSKLPEHMAP